MNTRIALASAFICILASSTILLAWRVEQFPIALNPHLSMNPLAATLFFASGLALLLKSPYRNFLGGVITSLASIKLLSFFGYDVKVDELFFRPLLPVFDAHPNTMGAFASVGLFSLGLSLMSFRPQIKSNVYPLSDFFVLPSLVVGVIGTVGFLYSVSEYSLTFNSRPIAIESSLLLLVASAGIIFYHGENGLIGVFLKATPSSVAGRRMIAFVVSVPIFVGWLGNFAQYKNLLTPEYGIAFMAILWSVLGTFLLWTRLHITNKFEAELSASRSREAESKLNRLKRFFPASIAEMILSGKIEDPFKWRRTEVTILFLDIRGFTRFSENGEPEEVMHLLQTYYLRVAKISQKHQGTVGHLAGDGVMIFFNAPLSVEYPQLKAVEMALELRAELSDLWNEFRYKEFELDFGAGIASGHTMVGGIGADGFWDYTVIGNAANVAARLCGIAKQGQILISHRFLSGVESSVEADSIGSHHLKGIRVPVKTFNVKSLADKITREKDLT